MTKLLSFEPKKLTVKVGATVTWEVSDQIGHTVTTGTFTVGGDGLRSAQQPDGTIDMPLTKGKSVSFTFGKPGTYTYYCSIHKGMNGEVEVTA
jgi:plastocyanin